MKVKLTQDIAIRDSVSTKYRQAGYVKYTQLSALAKKKCHRLSGNKAKLKKGNVVKVKKATTAWNGSIWIQIKTAGFQQWCLESIAYRQYRKQEGRCLPTFLLIINHALCFADDLNF